MTQSSPLARPATFHARHDHGQALAERLLHAALADAPDLSRDAELLDRYELDRVGEARYVHEQLGAATIGLTHYRLRLGRGQGWAHRHRLPEEIYVVLSRSGRITVDDDAFALQPLDAVRLAPDSAREFEAGSAGLEVLAFGSHIPGDGEMVSERPTHE